MVERERALELRESEQQLLTFKQQQLFSQRERDILKRERELDFQERLAQERSAELVFKQREVNQRLKDAVVWPLACLESESRLAEKIREVKVTPEYYGVVAGSTLDDERQLAEFYHREENRAYLKAIEGSNEVVRLRAEAVRKYEWVVLKERTKMKLLQDYMEGEL